MPTVNPSSVPSPRGMLGWDGANFYVLRTDAEGHLQIHALSSALPLGAATLAEQQTQTTALQLIDDLRNALRSVDTDALQVRGEDQLFSVKARYTEAVVNDAAAAGTNTLAGAFVPANTILVVTNISVQNTSNDTTRTYIVLDTPGDDVYLRSVPSLVKWTTLDWSGWQVLDVGSRISGVLYGCTAGDSIRLDVGGFTMTLEV